MEILIRRVEPGDYKAVQQVFRLEGTDEDRYGLVACVQGEAAGIGDVTTP